VPSRTSTAAYDEIDTEQFQQPQDPHIEKLRQLMDDSVSLEQAWSELNTEHLRERAAAATVEALMFSLRSGLSALSKPDTLRRLSQLSDEQLREVAVRLQKYMPHIAPAWTAKDVEILVGVRNGLNGKDA
jgi:hypothetical protein